MHSAAPGAGCEETGVKIESQGHPGEEAAEVLPEEGTCRYPVHAAAPCSSLNLPEMLQDSEADALERSDVCA